MRKLFMILSFLVMLAPPLTSAEAQAEAPEAGPRFVLGFATLADKLGDIAGTPIEDERHADNGDGLQQTTNGLMVWRKADNWTAFTNGTWSWVNGPDGVQDRSNADRFTWEYDDRNQPSPSAAPQPIEPTPAPAQTLDMAPAPVTWANPSVYHTTGPEYGMFAFLQGYGSYTQSSLGMITAAHFNWVKALLQWGQIEGKGRGIYDWEDPDRVVSSANQAGLRLIVRVEYTPSWARWDHNTAGPPDKYEDYGNFLNALASRYKQGSPHGHIDAIEVWNEPNLAYEWGNNPPNPAEYTRLLSIANNGVKMADPSIIVISAGLSPTGTNNADAMPDDVFLQKMYEAGAKGTFDVLGAHAPGYKAPPEMSPDQVAADPNYGGNRVFTFRRVEDLRNVMVRNGDSGRQVWLTEFGWTSDPVHPAYAWHAVSEQQKADYVIRAYQFARANWSPWIGVMSVWTLPRPDWSGDFEAYWWAIADPSGAARPAYAALKAARENGTLP